MKTDTESEDRTPLNKPHKSGGKKSAAVIPLDCPQFQCCMAAAENDPTISADDLLAMFRDIGVHGSLLELEVVASNLQQILELIESFEGWPALPDEVLGWRPLLDWILRQDTSVIPASEYFKTPHKSPLSGVCTTSHPLYALLWWTTDRSQLEYWHLLQGHVLLAHLRLISNDPGRYYDYRTSFRAPYSDILNRTYKAGVLLREISVHYAASSAELLRPDRPPQELAESLYYFWEHFAKGKKKASSQVQSGEDELDDQEAYEKDLNVYLLKTHRDTFRSHLRDFTSMLSTAYELRSSTERSGSHGGGSRETIQGFLPLMNLDLDQAEPDFSDPHKPVRALYRRVEAASSFGSKRGGAVRYQIEFDIEEDENEGVVFIDALPICSRKSGGGAANLVTTVLQGRARAEALENQLFLWDYEYLTDSAIQHLRRNMPGDFSEALHKKGAKAFLRAQSLALLAVLLGTGAGMTLSCQLKWVQSRQDLTGHHQFAYQFGASEQPGLWYVWIAPPSSWGGKYDKAQDLCADIQDSILCLPDVGRYGQYLNLLLHQYPDLRSSSRIFKKQKTSYQRDIKEYLRTIDPSGYLTLGRVENYLWRRCAGTGDIGEAGLIYAKKQRLGRVRRFYTTLPRAKLVDRYIQIMEQISDICWPSSDSESLSRSLPLDSTGYLGSLFRPKAGVIQSGVRALEELLDRQGRSLYASAKNRLKSPQELRADWSSYYNHYTLYTWLYFAYATASRTICKPFPENPAEGTTSGFIVHQDKDTLDQSHLRLLWVPELLLHQLQNQWNLAVQQIEELQNRRFRDDVMGSSFFMEGNRMVALCPKNLRPMLEQFLGGDMPVNSHRRFCRSHLLEQGCPGEIVDAFMVHWYAGESPWSRYSSQSALAYVAELKPYLERMLDTLGFRLQPLPTQNAVFHH
ncbi:hypothetical protein SIL73_05830 [Acidithiobacillus thiooxidans]|uniref:hypothetical protein n=1 Tax=Acidithiobacillus thiooxidans TaxID=930 RepID=UPI0029C23BF6|nr:hypothetical protein [Acidithiobacillus thiooxidans]MDX5934211.1 hypothetical protein [Acidithiobacillus thiooxidans]